MSNLNESTLIKAQAISGGIFGTFLSLHLANAATGLFGHLVYDGVQRVFRVFYQNPLVEPIMLGSLGVHLTISAYRYLKRRSTFKLESTNPLQLHRYTGLFMSIFIFGHVGAVRFAPLIYKLPTGFGTISFAMESWPYIFIPYYALFAISGLYHMSYGFIQNAKLANLKVPAALNPRKRPFWTFIGVGSIVLFAAVLRFAGWYGVPPRETYPIYQNFYDTQVPMFKSMYPWNN